MVEPLALLIKRTQGMTFAEVRGKIYYKIKPENSGVEVFSIWGWRNLRRISPKTNGKDTSRVRLKGPLEKKIFVSSLEPMCSSEIRNMSNMNAQSQRDRHHLREFLRLKTRYGES